MNNARIRCARLRNKRNLLVRVRRCERVDKSTSTLLGEGLKIPFQAKPSDTYGIKGSRLLQASLQVIYRQTGAARSKCAKCRKKRGLAVGGGAPGDFGKSFIYQYPRLSGSATFLESAEIGSGDRSARTAEPFLDVINRHIGILAKNLYAAWEADTRRPPHCPPGCQSLSLPRAGPFWAGSTKVFTPSCTARETK